MDVRLSKFLSLVLRHRPELIGVTLDRAGWVPVPELLEAMARHGRPITRERLAEIVAANDKRRFALDRERDRIRAEQGHTVPVDLELPEAEPPRWLYHGTTARSLSGIRREGLLRGRRHHVHLSPDVATAVRVGSRRGRPVVLRVDAAGMADDGHVFYLSGNGVWLTGYVPARYLVAVDVPVDVPLDVPADAPAGAAGFPSPAGGTSPDTDPRGARRGVDEANQQPDPEPARPQPAAPAPESAMASGTDEGTPAPSFPDTPLDQEEQAIMRALTEPAGTADSDGTDDGTEAGTEAGSGPERPA